MAVSMTICLATYFWVACIVLIIKIALTVNGVVVDVCFFVISLIAMLLIFASIMKERCGTAPLGSVLGAVLLPWFMMVGAVIILIRSFPGWIQPFSNTFGYLVCLIPGMNSREKLTAVLTSKSSMTKLITEDPTLMLNQFSTSNFDRVIDKMIQSGVIVAREINPGGLSDLKTIVHLKDSVSEFIWHLLIGCVAITTAYNNMMNTVCQRESIKEVPRPSTSTP
jgi:hypothetical protein